MLGIEGWDPRPFPKPNPDVIDGLSAEVTTQDWTAAKSWLIRHVVAQLTGADTRTWTPEQALAWLEFLGATGADQIELMLRVNLELEAIFYPTGRVSVLGNPVEALAAARPTRDGEQP